MMLLNSKAVKAQPQATVNAKLILLLLLSTAKVRNINWTTDGDSMKARHRPLLCKLTTGGGAEATKLHFAPDTCKAPWDLHYAQAEFQLCLQEPCLGVLLPAWRPNEWKQEEENNVYKTLPWQEKQEEIKR